MAASSQGRRGTMNDILGAASVRRATAATADSCYSFRAGFGHQHSDFHFPSLGPEETSRRGLLLEPPNEEPGRAVSERKPSFPPVSRTVAAHMVRTHGASPDRTNSHPSMQLA